MQKNQESLKNELSQLSELLSKDLSNWDIRTKSGMLGRQNAAKIRIEEVKKDLAYFILKNSTTFLLMRDYEQTGTVVESARKNPEANVVLDALMIEKKIFKTIFGDNYKSLTFNSDIVNRMNILMSEIGMKIEALSIPTILGDARHFGTLRTREEMIDRMERVIFETYGDELKGHFFRAVILDEVAARITRDGINIVMVNVTQKMIRAFSSYAGKTQILSNESTETPQLTKTKPALSRTTTQSVVAETPAEAVQQPEVQEAAVRQIDLSENTETTTKKPYTGARRGRKTDAERAAIAAQKAADGGTEKQG